MASVAGHSDVVGADPCIAAPSMIINASPCIPAAAPVPHIPSAPASTANTAPLLPSAWPAAAPPSGGPGEFPASTEPDSTPNQSPSAAIIASVRPTPLPHFANLSWRSAGAVKPSSSSSSRKPAGALASLRRLLIFLKTCRSLHRENHGRQTNHCRSRLSRPSLGMIHVWTSQACCRSCPKGAGPGSCTYAQVRAVSTMPRNWHR